MKKTILTIIQVAVTLGILGWLFRDPERNREMLNAVTQADTGWILAALFIFVIVELLAVWRWQVLLKVQGIVIGWWRLTALMTIGLFFNVFLPGGTGGDVVKIFYLLKETPGKKAAAMLAVVMDRIVGLLGLIVMAAAFIALRYGWLTQTRATSGLLYLLIFLFGGAIGFVTVSWVVTRYNLIHLLPQRLPLRDKIVELSVAYTHYGRAWRSTLGALIISLPVHLFSSLQFYFAALAFEAAAKKVTMLDFLTIMPIINTLAAMPVSIGGVGVREGMFISLLGDLCGVDKATAVVISLTGYLVIVFWGLVGGILYLFYRPSTHASLGEMEHTVAKLEHQIADAEEPPRAER